MANEDDPDVKGNPSVLEEVKRMRLNLIKMAVAGQGGNPSEWTVANMYDAPFQPFFATNSTELLEAFRQAIIAVNKSDAVQPGKGGIVQTPPSAGEDLPSMFSTSYSIVQANQWEGGLTRYIVSSDSAGNLTLPEDWEFGDKLLAQRGNRNLKYWKGDDGQFTPFNEGDAKFAQILGINGRISPTNLPGGTFGSNTPDKALYWWLQGYDYSYKRGGIKYPRSSMLADFGQSGVVYADFPSV